jgi:hypothetical protein
MYLENQPPQTRGDNQDYKSIIRILGFNEDEEIEMIYENDKQKNIKQLLSDIDYGFISHMNKKDREE